MTSLRFVKVPLWDIFLRCNGVLDLFHFLSCFGDFLNDSIFAKVFAGGEIFADRNIGFEAPDESR